MTDAIVANGVVRRYGDRVALAGLDLSVPAGSVFGLLGPNGSGKSTFIALLAAMEQPESGSISVLSEPLHPAARSRVGTVFQENAQDPLMTPNELLALAGAVFGVTGDELRSRRSELLAQFDLSDRANEPIANLSGGMRRRLEVARALLHDPDLLLLDEPTTGVDPGQRQALWSALQSSSRPGRTILLATNDLLEADAVCDCVAFIRAGKVAAIGTPEQLKAGLRAETLRVEWVEPDAASLQALRRMPGVGDVSADGETVQVSCDRAADLVPELFKLAGNRIRSVALHEATLEDAYFRYTGARIAEEPAA